MSEQELKALMDEFKKTRGWQIIREWLEVPIKFFTAALLENENLTIEEQKLYKRELKNYKRFYEFPDYIVDKSKKGLSPSEEETSLDPYE